MEVRCEDDGMWYQAVVEHETADGNFMVRFDRDGYEYHYPLTAWRVRLPRASSLVAMPRASSLVASWQWGFESEARQRHRK